MSKKTITLACAAALCATSGTVPGTMTGIAGAQASRGDDAVTVSITNRRGRSVGMRALPAADRARVERLRESASQLQRQQAGQARRIRGAIRCTWPPLRCEIVIIISF